MALRTAPAHHATPLDREKEDRRLCHSPRDRVESVPIAEVGRSGVDSDLRCAASTPQRHTVTGPWLSRRHAALDLVYEVQELRLARHPPGPPAIMRMACSARPTGPAGGRGGGGCGPCSQMACTNGWPQSVDRSP